MTQDPLIRTAWSGDEERLRELDLLTFSPAVSPGTAPRPDSDMFLRHRPEDYLVAELDGLVAGYVTVGHPTPLPASAHVIQIQGLAVDPAVSGRGIGRSLVHAAIEEGRRRGARKISLRVLGWNSSAQRLYAGVGFSVEGRLVAEFMLQGQPVDDILMALHLAT